MKKALIVLILIFASAAALLTLGLLFAFPGASEPRGASVLYWELDGPLAEASGNSPSLFPSTTADLTLAEAYSALRRARTDSRIRRLAVYFRSPTFGLAKAEELRRQFELLRQAGKPVACFLESAGEGTNGTLPYFVASACDTIALAPAGELNLLGLYAEGLFVRSTLDKLRITPNFTSAGIYKSAIETYTRSDRSAAAEQAVTAVLNHDFETLVASIAERRSLSPLRVAEIIDRGLFGAAEALQERLVDELLYPDEFLEQIHRLEDQELQRVNIQDYAARTTGSGPRIAVVFASGVIMRGASDSGGLWGERVVGSDDLVDCLDAVAEDEDINAVVLRVDSPGGSALASDLMLRALDRLATKKPLVASLSDVAASGGYYIVSHAPVIVAESTTLTGSIGVFSGKLVTGRFESELLGIDRDPLKRGSNADIYSSNTAFSPAQAALMQSRVDEIYERFLGHVTKGRKLNRDEAHALAQGRIWSGHHAFENRLVDHVGGLDLALELAAKAAGIEPSRVVPVYLPEAPSLFDQLTSLRSATRVSGFEAMRRELLPREPAALELAPSLAKLVHPF